MKNIKLLYFSLRKGSDHIQMPSVQLLVDASTRNYIGLVLPLDL